MIGKNIWRSIKTLIKHGADPYRKLEGTGETPFTSAFDGFNSDIINYYIDSLNVDVHQGMRTVLRQPKKEIAIFYIQDYVMTPAIYSKLWAVEFKPDSIDMSTATEEDVERLKLIKKLQTMGVDFKDYIYKSNKY